MTDSWKKTIKENKIFFFFLHTKVNSNSLVKVGRASHIPSDIPYVFIFLDKICDVAIKFK